MVATKTPRKTSTPAAAKSAGRVKAPTETAPVVLPVSEKVVEEAAVPVSEAPTNKAPVNEAPVSEAVEPPQPEAAPEPVVAAVAEPAVIPEPVAVVAAEPEPASEPEEPEDTGIAVDEGIEQLASLTEQVIYEAEAIAGEAAHNFQVAFKAVTDAQSVVPALSGINTYLHRSVRINAQFVEEFAGVRSPVDLVNLQVRFLEEHRLVMLEFTQSWTSRKSAA
jgi:hypothetical protein